MVRCTAEIRSGSLHTFSTCSCVQSFRRGRHSTRSKVEAVPRDKLDPRSIDASIHRPYWKALELISSLGSPKSLFQNDRARQKLLSVVPVHHSRQGHHPPISA